MQLGLTMLLSISIQMFEFIFFLVAPELSQLSEQAKNTAGVSFSGERSRHHTLTTAVFSREEKSVEKLLTTMESFTNPFEQESDALFNLVTKVVMPEKRQEGSLRARYHRGKTISTICRRANRRTKSQSLGPHEEAKALHLEDCREKSQSKR